MAAWSLNARLVSLPGTVSVTKAYEEADVVCVGELTSDDRSSARAGVKPSRLTWTARLHVLDCFKARVARAHQAFWFLDQRAQPECQWGISREAR